MSDGEPAVVNRELRKRLSKRGAALLAEISVETVAPCRAQQGGECPHEADLKSAAEESVMVPVPAEGGGAGQQEAFSLESMLSFTGYDGAFLSAAGAQWNYWFSAAGELLEPSTPATPRTPKKGLESPALPRRRGSAAALSSTAKRQQQYLSDSVALLDAFSATEGGRDGATVGVAAQAPATRAQAAAPATPARTPVETAADSGDADTASGSPVVRKFEKLQRRGYIRVGSRSREGRWYWFNRVTGESVWERAAETKEWNGLAKEQSLMPPPLARPPEPAASAMPALAHDCEGASQEEEEQKGGEEGADEDEDEDEDSFEDAAEAAAIVSSPTSAEPILMSAPKPAAPAADLFAGLESLLDSPSVSQPAPSTAPVAAALAPNAVPVPAPAPTLSPAKPNPDLIPQRFLNATKGDAAKAALRWKATCDWRQENHIDEILQEKQPHFVLIREHYPSVFHGRSRKGERGLLGHPANAALLS